MTADEMTEALYPLRDNPLAGFALARLALADDPDAMAEQIRAELQPMFDAALAFVKAAQRVLYDVAGPN